MPFTPRQRRQRVLLRRWSHSLAVRLPARLLREAGFSEDTPLTAELSSDGSVCLRPEARFDRQRFSWEQSERQQGMTCTDPTWPLLRQIPGAPEDGWPEAHPPNASESSWEPYPTYLDTGVLLPLIAREPGSDAHLRWFRSEARLLVTSALSALEASAALALKGLRPAEHQAASEQLLHLLHGGGIWRHQLSESELSRWGADTHEEAGSGLHPPLHPLAQQHLATAVLSGCRRLISPDPALCQAARQAGLQAHRPPIWPTRLRCPPVGDWPPHSPIRP